MMASKYRSRIGPHILHFGGMTPPRSRQWTKSQTANWWCGRTHRAVRNTGRICGNGRGAFCLLSGYDRTRNVSLPFDFPEKSWETHGGHLNRQISGATQKRHLSFGLTALFQCYLSLRAAW